MKSLDRREQGFGTIEQHVMPSAFDFDELTAPERGREGLGSFPRQQSALAAPDQQDGASNRARFRPWARGKAEPAAIEFVSESAVRLFTDRVFRDRATEFFPGFARLRKEAETRDGFLTRGIGASEREGESGSPPGSRCASQREIDQRGTARLGMSTRVVVGDRGAE